MHKFALAIFILVVSFGAPFIAMAQEGPAACSVTNPCPSGSTCNTTSGLCVTTSPTGSSGVTLMNPLGTSCNSTNTDCLGAFLGNILDFVIRIGTIVVILMLVFVGFKFVTAQGSDTKITEARGMLLWTVVGALILLGAKAIQVGITATVKALGG